MWLLLLVCLLSGAAVALGSDSALDLEHPVVLLKAGIYHVRFARLRELNEELRPLFRRVLGEVSQARALLGEVNHARELLGDVTHAREHVSGKRQVGVREFSGTAEGKQIVRGVPCVCAGTSCECCAIISVRQFNFTQLGCLNVTYDPSDLAVSLKAIFNHRTLFETGLSGKNPPPICFPIPTFPGISFCVRVYDIHVEGADIFACVKLELQVLSIPVLVINFDCIRLGASGFGITKPRPEAGVVNPPPDVDTRPLATASTPPSTTAGVANPPPNVDTRPLASVSTTSSTTAAASNQSDSVSSTPRTGMQDQDTLSTNEDVLTITEDDLSATDDFIPTTMETFTAKDSFSTNQDVLTITEDDLSATDNFIPTTMKSFPVNTSSSIPTPVQNTSELPNELVVPQEVQTEKQIFTDYKNSSLKLEVEKV